MDYSDHAQREHHSPTAMFSRLSKLDLIPNWLAHRNASSATEIFANWNLSLQTHTVYKEGYWLWFSRIFTLKQSLAAYAMQTIQRPGNFAIPRRGKSSFSNNNPSPARKLGDYWNSPLTHLLDAHFSFPRGIRALPILYECIHNIL